MAVGRPSQDFETAYHEGVSAERDRIGRELHHGVIHALFAVGLSLQTAAAEANDERLRRRLEDASDAIDDAIKALRDHLFRTE